MAAVFADDIFKCIFNENVWISIKILVKLVAKSPINGWFTYAYMRQSVSELK